MSLRTIVALAVLAVLSPAAWAQGYPNKPVRVIVTFPPGGTPDIYGRIMSVELGKLWNQSVVVENRTGAGGTIGTDFVAKAAPDGYTLLFAADATITIAPHLYTKLSYDPQRDLAPIVNGAAERSFDRRDTPRIRHHRLVRLHGARGNAARDREEDPRRCRRGRAPSGFSRAAGPRRHRARRQLARGVRRRDQIRPREMGED